MEEYDLAIIGAGPAGLSAGLYAGRYKLKAAVIGEIPGGTITTAHRVDNFPSYDTITGMELGKRMVDQVKNNNVEIIFDKIKEVKQIDKKFSIKGYETDILAKKLILAIGTKKRILGLPREKELTGKGVSYCATCDGLFFKDKIVGMIGGSDSALSEAIYLASVAKKVYIIYRKSSFARAEPVWVDAVLKNPKIEPVFNSNVVELMGEKRLEKIKLDTGKEIELNGLFIAIGSEPQKDFLAMCGVKTDEAGYVIVDRKMRTNVHGIFSAGDLNEDTFEQAIVAAGEGATATNTAYEEIKKEESD